LSSRSSFPTCSGCPPARPPDPSMSASTTWDSTSST
jgi:hypothetical protein